MIHHSKKKKESEETEETVLTWRHGDGLELECDLMAHLAEMNLLYSRGRCPAFKPNHSFIFFVCVCVCVCWVGY